MTKGSRDQDHSLPHRIQRLAAQTSRGKVFLLVLILGATLAMACGGGAAPAAPTTPSQQAPAALLQPAPAAPAAEPSAPLFPAPVPRTELAKSPPPPAGRLPKHGGVATFAVRRDPPGGWDIMQQAIYFDLHQMGGPLWGDGNLVRRCLDDAYKVCPGLAESWESNSDFTQWTFKVREGVTWHDGTPLTVEHVKYWAELAYFGAKSADGAKTRRPSLFKAEFGDLQKVEVLPGNRVRFTLGRRRPLLLETLSNAVYTIALPKHLTQPRIAAGDVTVTPQEIGFVGTGPFKILQYDKGSRAQERRFDKYWEKDKGGRQLPYLDGIDFAILLDPAAMDAAFRVGRLDGGSPGSGHRLTPERQQGYIRDLGDQVWFAKLGVSSAATSGLGYNMLRQGPWQDRRVRLATALWIDKEASIAGAQGGFGYISPILHPDSPFTSPEWKTWPGFDPSKREQNRAQAKRLMAEAGYPNGFTINYNCFASVIWQARCVFLNGQLRGLGIDLKLHMMDAARWAEAANSLEFDAVQTGTSVEVPLPEATEKVLNAFSIATGATFKHEDPKVVDLFRRLSEATTFEQRVKLWRELEQYVLAEQVYFVPIAQQYGVIPYRAHVKGRIVPPEGIMNYMSFATVWLDK